jgi:hypothetical protein
VSQRLEAVIGEVGLQIPTNRVEVDLIVLRKVCKVRRSNEPHAMTNMAQGACKGEVWLHIAARSVAE